LVLKFPSPPKADFIEVVPIGRGGCILSLFGEGEPLAVGVDRIYNSKSIIYNYRSIIPPRPLLNKSIGVTTPRRGELAQSTSAIKIICSKGRTKVSNNLSPFGGGSLQGRL